MGQTPAKFRLTWWLVTTTLVCITVLSACGSSSNDRSPLDDDAGTSPTEPGNLTYTVYSPHAIQLFWSDSTDDGWVMGYDMYRDGVLVADRLDANSYFEGDLEPANTYQYRVVAVDDDGNRSLPAGISLTTDSDETPGGDGSSNSTSIITVDNHVELLRHVFDIYTGNAYIPDVLTLPDWTDPAYNGTPGFMSVEANITCLNGGTARFIPFYSDDGDSNTRAWWEFHFDNCQDDAVILDGQLHREYWGGRGSGTNGKVVSSGLSTDEQSRQLRYRGTVYEQLLFLSGRSASDVNYSVSDVLSMFELSNANTGFSNYPVDGTFTMSGAFTVVSDATGNRALGAEVLERFEVRPPAFFDEPSNIGVLELSGDDGSKLVLTADNGDFESVLIEISTSGIVSETLTQPWSLWADNLRIELGIHNLWFSN